MNKKLKYHRSCYRGFTTKVKNERAKGRYKDTSLLSDVSLVQRKAGRPPLDKPAQEKEDETIVLHSQGCSFNKILCICQECGDAYMTWSLLPQAKESSTSLKSTMTKERFTDV